MNRARPPELLMENAIIEGRPVIARKHYDLVRKDSGSSKLMIHYYHEARILLLERKLLHALQELRAMRVLDGTPFGTYLFIKALYDFRTEKTLAENLLEQFEREIESYAPTSSDELPKSYFEKQFLQLKADFEHW
jgi:hypothetical protein